MCEHVCAHVCEHVCEHVYEGALLDDRAAQSAERRTVSPKRLSVLFERLLSAPRLSDSFKRLVCILFVYIVFQFLSGSQFGGEVPSVKVSSLILQVLCGIGCHESADK